MHLRGTLNTSVVVMLKVVILRFPEARLHLLLTTSVSLFLNNFYGLQTKGANFSVDGKCMWEKKEFAVQFTRMPH